MIDFILTALGVTFLVLAGAWVVRRLGRGLRRAAGPEAAVEDARTMAVDMRGYRTGRLDRVLAGDFDLF